MSEKEAIKRLNHFTTIKVLYGNTFAMNLDTLEQLQEDIDTVLQLLKQKDKGINKLMLKRKKWKNKYYKEKNKVRELDNKINNAINWIENTINDSHVIGCNLGDLQLLLDILEE